MSANDNKRIQSIDSIKTYAYGMRKDLVCRKENLTVTIWQNNTKMINFNCVTK